jgi:hypothetical protein
VPDVLGDPSELIRDGRAAMRRHFRLRGLARNASLGLVGADIFILRIGRPDNKVCGLHYPGIRFYFFRAFPIFSF